MVQGSSSFNSWQPVHYSEVKWVSPTVRRDPMVSRIVLDLLFAPSGEGACTCSVTLPQQFAQRNFC